MARFDGGWVKIRRKALLGDINSNFTRGGLFVALVGMANIQESVVSWRGRPRNMGRGEICTSLTELASLGGTDRSTVLRHLNYLELRGTISLEKSNKGIIIKLLKFDYHQGLDAEGPHQAQQQTHIGHNNDRTHIEQVNNKTKKQKVPSSIFEDDWVKEAEVFMQAARLCATNPLAKEWLGEERWALVKALGGFQFIRDLKPNAFELRRLAGLLSENHKRLAGPTEETAG